MGAAGAASTFLLAVVASGFFFLRGEDSDSFELRLRFWDRSLVEPKELSQDFAVFAVLRLSEFSSLGTDFFLETEFFVWTALGEKIYACFNSSTDISSGSPSTLGFVVNSAVSASARLEAFERSVIGAIKGRKLDELSKAAACRPGADAKSHKALFSTGNVGAHGSMVCRLDFGTLKSIFQPGSAHSPLEDGGIAEGCFSSAAG